MRILPILFSALFIPNAWGDWKFTDKVDITPQYDGSKVFHHLDASGRKSMAVSEDTVALVWEDNHTGLPQVYVSFKNTKSDKFTKPIKLSTGKEAYEPTIVSIGRYRFAVAWEQDENVWINTISHNTPGKPVKLSGEIGKQISLLKTANDKLLAAWVKSSGSNHFIVAASISLDNKGLHVGEAKIVDGHKGDKNQSNPVLGQSGKTIGVIWEDRRHGHNTLLYSKSKDGEVFSKPKILNEIVKKSDKYGKGSGVTRVAISNCGDQYIAATWMDKRNRQTGYDIFAALGKKNDFEFGRNQQVQDSFGDNLAQWNPAIAGSQTGDIVIAWYDNREESMDILMSTKTDDGWSDDELVAPASGEGDQTNVVMVFDHHRQLHIVWIHQDNQASPTRLYYSIGTLQ